MAQPPLFGLSEAEGENANKSVFVVFNFVSGPVKGAVYQFKIGRGGQVLGGVIKDANEPPLLSPDHTFFEDKGNNSLPVTLLGASYFGASKLYLMLHADFSFPPSNIHIPIPKSHSVDGLVFDAKTMSLGRFSPPMEHKLSGFLASAYGKLYYIATASPYPEDLTVPFERYDPTTDSWESLPPCPEDMNISGYAVCQDCILFSFMLANYSSKLMVFHINTKQWHEVEAPSDDDDDTFECLHPFPFQGQAVVVGDTIYAISQCYLQLIAFSLRIKSNEIDCPSYFIDILNRMPVLDHVFPPSRFHGSISRFLVHLVNLEFCLVESGFNYKSSRRQHLCITTFRVDLGEGNLKRIQTLHSKVLDAELLHESSAIFVSSFTPDYDDTESQEGKSPIMASDAVEVPSADEDIEPSGKATAYKKQRLEAISMELA